MYDAKESVMPISAHGNEPKEHGRPIQVTVALCCSVPASARAAGTLHVVVVVVVVVIVAMTDIPPKKCVSRSY